MRRSLLVTFALVLGALQLPAGPQDASPNKDLIQYVQDARKAGLKDAQIQQNALKAGWPSPDVKSAFDFLRSGGKPAAGAPAAAKSEPKGAPVVDADPPAQATPAATPVAATAMPPEGGNPKVAPPADMKPADQKPPETTTPPAAAPPAATPDPAKPPEAAGAVTKPPANRGVADDYRIGQGDVLAVSVWGEAAASVGGVVVRSDGKITMPLIKDVAVDGMTPAEAEKLITELLSKQIKAADVTVIVNQVNSKKIFILGGGAKREGPLPYTHRMRVMEALSETGGLSDYAKRKKIYILREEGGRQFQFPFDYDAVLRGQRMDLNIVLLPGDTIVVPNH